MSLRIRVSFTGQLARAAGVKEQTWEAPEGTTPADLVVALARERGGEFAALLLNAEGQPRPTTLWVVNGEQVASEPGGRPLEDKAEVVLMTPIAGG
ncbi:MAG: Molybdopterin converting factor, small subunit [Verrucomicrobia bacterium]|jgi:molybdopterin converting factor small subunit|nr:MAG: Molybdopterin converting factor, small subunit [Verrucomicrobiota bacterium]